MALLNWPTQAEITNLEYEVWYPGQIVPESVTGDLSQYPIILGTPRLKGNATIRLYSAWAEDQRRESNLVEAFLNQFSRPDNTVNMPWGGDLPLKSTPGVGFVRQLTAIVEGTSRLFTLRDKTGSVHWALTVGMWIKSPLGRICQVTSVTNLSATEDQVTLEPDPSIGLGGPSLTQEFTPATTILVRTPVTDDTGVRHIWSGDWKGPWSISWREEFA